MTITAIAKELNTSTMTIYRRLKKAEINLADLRDDKSGEITPAGASVISSLFSPEEVAQDQTGGDATTDTAGAVAVLQARLDGANALIDQLTDERNQLRDQVKQLTAALQAEQADRGQERQLLTGGVETPRRRWRWPWTRD